MKKILVLVVVLMLVFGLSGFTVAAKEENNNDNKGDNEKGSNWVELTLKAPKDCIKACGNPPKGNDNKAQKKYQMCIADCNPKIDFLHQAINVFEDINDLFNVDSFFDVFVSITNRLGDLQNQIEHLQNQFDDIQSAYEELLARVIALESGVCIDGTTRSCYSGPQGTKNVGVCHAGTQTCEDGAWLDCEGQITPTTELCNNLDDDCDGSTDEDLTTQITCGFGACLATGQLICADGVIQDTCTPGTPGAEVCDDKDNDCDEEIDEDCCPPGQTNCGGLCVDLNSDSGNCRSCYNACPQGKSCQQGLCQCSPPQTDCGGLCIDLNSDSGNCGSCYNACPQGKSCQEGQCK